MIVIRSKLQITNRYPRFGHSTEWMAHRLLTDVDNSCWSISLLVYFVRKK